MKTGKIRIRPGETGKAKGGKGRIVYNPSQGELRLCRLELNYEKLISKSIFFQFDPFSFDVRIEQQKSAVIHLFRDKEFLMNKAIRTVVYPVKGMGGCGLIQ